MSEWDKEFNKILKEKLGSRSEVPTEALWDKVLAGLPPEPVPTQKRSRLLLLMAIGLVASTTLLLRFDDRQAISLDSISTANATVSIPNEVVSNTQAPGSNETTLRPATVQGNPYLSTNKESGNGLPPTINRIEDNQVQYASESPSLALDPNQESRITLANQDKTLLEEPLKLAMHQSSLDLNEEAFLIDSSEFVLAAVQDTATQEKELVQKSALQWDIALLGGPNVGYRRMNSDVHADLVAHRNSHEKSSLNFNGGVEVGLSFHKVRVSLGFGYFERGEHYVFQGQTVKHEYRNKYTYFSVPVNVSYVLLRYRKLTLSPVVTYAFNRLQHAQASWLNPHNHSEVHMSSDHNNPYQKTGHMLSGSVQLAYQLRKVKVVYRVGYTHFLQSIYKPAMALDQRQYGVDQQIGLIIPLSKPLGQ